MNSQDLNEKVSALEAALLQFERGFDMEDIRKKRTQYFRLTKRKTMNTLHPDMQKSLRSAHSVMDRYRKKKRVLDGWRKKQESIIDGCQNCRRKQPCGENSQDTPYLLIFIWHPENILIKRRQLRFFRIDDSSDELVGLCLECSE